MPTTRTPTLSSREMGSEHILRARTIAALEEDRSGRQPINPDLWPALRTGEAEQRHLFLSATGRPTADPALACGYACIDTSGRAAELALVPDREALCTGLADAVTDFTGGPVSIWVRGRAASTKALIRNPERRLLVLRRVGPIPQTPGPSSGIRIRTWNRRDRDAWLALNAAVFANLPDQGAMTGADLESLTSRSWFDESGFLLAEQQASPGPSPRPNSAANLVGFHWTKLSPDERLHGAVSGEVFALGVEPSFRGTGLARHLLIAGLDHLWALGARNQHLYVDATNEPARALYASGGFTECDEDVLVAWPAVS